MSHSADQEKIVLKILSHQPHQYYEILSVTKTASDGEIKKSYRKLAIKLHPDKNPHPRAAEAFKYLNKAWEVLSDPSKRKIFDQTGADPDSRGAAGYSSASAYGGSPFGNTSGFTQHRFNSDFSDDIFNMFFGGGMPQGQTFTFGNNGFTFNTFGGVPEDFFTNVRARSQQRRQQERRYEEQQRRKQPSGWDTIMQILPLIIIILGMLLSTLFAEDTPDFSFSKTSKFNVQRKTPVHNIPFYVKPGFTKDISDRQLKNFDKKVEASYIRDTQNNCAREQIKRNDLMEDAQGWFFTDQRKLEQAEKMPMPNCRKLRDMGIL
ncbi:Chaperone protein dnaJ [Candidozyma auris]|uniref:J domain-containing protein n=2 Tax=Candidozyma auris TaxID=498019 RepID=A0AB36W207_CANAR|nr:hypothetical protein QG37_08130 [[Candida] auris]PIS52497.1 hypothetical protein CJI97_002142 [[Candida] auris]PIS54813.1 hypothetical protein B9J08_001957 [[Candida] auris]PSK75172.1 hypothetical protein CJJ07_005044 [[Candida] auris]QEL60914.1 hypothetical protein CJJ09_003045 [[Candida] auris]